MIRFLIGLLLLFTVSYSFAQSKEFHYNKPQDTLCNYVLLYQPKTQVKGLLLLLPSLGESPQEAFQETELPKAAAEKGWITAIASLQYGTNSFYIDSLSQNALDTLISQLDARFDIRNRSFYIGGFSLGGAGAVKYAERAYSSQHQIRPKAVFAIDPPLDFERFYNSLQHEQLNGKPQETSSEAEYLIKRLQYEFQGSPLQTGKVYQQMSPYSYTDLKQTNIQALIGCPIRLICEPEIDWQMENRARSLYDLNVIDCSSMMNSLRNLGNKHAVLSLTSNKGFRKSTGKRNPHSWSIANSQEVVDWLKQFQ